MEHIVPWLSLKSVSGIGNLLFNRLVNHFGRPDKVLQAPAKSLQHVAGISSKTAAAIAGHKTPDFIINEIERCAAKGFQIITQHDLNYPALLLHIPDPPPVLYCYGSLHSDTGHIAVVGSRKATSYGKACAQNLSRELASKGFSIVSGMARGIDTAAHIGTLKGSGSTIAVLGSGLEQIYPAENVKLFHRIAEKGAVISEFPLNAVPVASHFPQRNRIISGMALGTVIVEAERRSGALITARLAADQGREVFAIPGNIHATTARGTHKLIKQGAKLVETAEDIIEEIAPLLAVSNPLSPPPIRTPAAVTTSSFSKFESKLLDTISSYPVHVDELARRCNHDMGTLMATLLQLELKGAVNQAPGKFFMRSNEIVEND